MNHPIAWPQSSQGEQARRTFPTRSGPEVWLGSPRATHRRDHELRNHITWAILPALAPKCLRLSASRSTLARAHVSIWQLMRNADGSAGYATRAASRTISNFSRPSFGGSSGRPVLGMPKHHSREYSIAGDAHAHNLKRIPHRCAVGGHGGLGTRLVACNIQFWTERRAMARRTAWFARQTVWNSVLQATSECWCPRAHAVPAARRRMVRPLEQTSAPHPRYGQR
jgi:hypothetical protein